MASAVKIFGANDADLEGDLHVLVESIIRKDKSVVEAGGFLVSQSFAVKFDKNNCLSSI